MLNNFFKKPENVTRFIGRKSHYNEKFSKPTTGAFYREQDLKIGAISVFDIDNELKRNDDAKIFKLGDEKVFKKGTLARADLKVEDIEKIKSHSANLYLRKSKIGKHCSIKNFPKDEEMARYVDGQLALISNLVVRKK